MTFDLSTIIYLIFLLIIIGLVIKLGHIFVSFVLLGLAALTVIFVLLVIADFLTGGTALRQIANALVPFAATIAATVAAWIKLKLLTPPPGKYE